MILRTVTDACLRGPTRPVPLLLGALALGLWPVWSPSPGGSPFWWRPGGAPWGGYRAGGRPPSRVARPWAAQDSLLPCWWWQRAVLRTSPSTFLRDAVSASLRCPLTPPNPLPPSSGFQRSSGARRTARRPRADGRKGEWRGRGLGTRAGRVSLGGPRVPAAASERHTLRRRLSPLGRCGPWVTGHTAPPALRRGHAGRSVQGRLPGW